MGPLGPGARAETARRYLGTSPGVTLGQTGSKETAVAAAATAAAEWRPAIGREGRQNNRVAEARDVTAVVAAVAETVAPGAWVSLRAGPAAAPALAEGEMAGPVGWPSWPSSAVRTRHQVIVMGRFAVMGRRVIAVVGPTRVLREAVARVPVPGPVARRKAEAIMVAPRDAKAGVAAEGPPLHYRQLEVGQFALWKLWRLKWLWLGFPMEAVQLWMWLWLKPDMYRAPRLVGAKPMELRTDDGSELDARL